MACHDRIASHRAANSGYEGHDKQVHQPWQMSAKSKKINIQLAKRAQSPLEKATPKELMFGKKTTTPANQGKEEKHGPVSGRKSPLASANSNAILKRKQSNDNTNNTLIANEVH